MDSRFVRISAVLSLLFACKPEPSEPTTSTDPTVGSTTTDTDTTATGTETATVTTFESSTTTTSDGETTTTTSDGDTTTTGTGTTTTTVTTVDTGVLTMDEGVGTTFAMLPEECSMAVETCAPLGSADSCPTVESELWEQLGAECDGELYNIANYSRDGECCLLTRCEDEEIEGKACVPLAATDNCGRDNSLPQVDLWEQCDLAVGTITPTYVDGDNCCLDFDCYCGGTGG